MHSSLSPSRRHPALLGCDVRGGVRCTQAALGPILRHRVRREMRLVVGDVGSVDLFLVFVH